MFTKLILSSAEELSVFYLTIPTTYFRQAANTCHHIARDALRDIGRKYLAKAGRVVPAHERSP